MQMTKTLPISDALLAHMREQARYDPRQVSLFGPGHEQELQQKKPDAPSEDSASGVSTH